MLKFTFGSGMSPFVHFLWRKQDWEHCGVFLVIASHWKELVEAEGGRTVWVLREANRNDPQRSLEFAVCRNLLDLSIISVTVMTKWTGSWLWLNSVFWSKSITLTTATPVSLFQSSIWCKLTRWCRCFVDVEKCKMDLTVVVAGVRGLTGVIFECV